MWAQIGPMIYFWLCVDSLWLCNHPTPLESFLATSTVAPALLEMAPKHAEAWKLHSQSHQLYKEEPHHGFQILDEPNNSAIEFFFKCRGQGRCPSIPSVMKQWTLELKDTAIQAPLDYLPPRSHSGPSRHQWWSEVLCSPASWLGMWTLSQHSPQTYAGSHWRCWRQSHSHPEGGGSWHQGQGMPASC